MSYIGMATASGQVIVIPVILRSLAETLGHIRPRDLPITFDCGFIAVLDVGTTDDQFARVVRSYSLPWWSATRAPVDGGILSAQTLDTCLAYHRRQLTFDIRGNSIPALPIVPLSCLTFDSHSGIARGPAEVSATASSPTIHPLLAADMLRHIQATKNNTSALVVSASTQLDLTTRRVSGFLALHEKVLLKEMQSDSIEISGKGSGTKTARLSRAVGEMAKAALERMDPDG